MRSPGTGAFGFEFSNLTIDDFQNPNKVVQLGVPAVRVDLITSLTGVSWGGAAASKEPTMSAGKSRNPIRWCKSDRRRERHAPGNRATEGLPGRARETDADVAAGLESSAKTWKYSASGTGPAPGIAPIAGRILLSEAASIHGSAPRVCEGLYPSATPRPMPTRPLWQSR